MSLRSILSQVLYDDEKYNTNENGETTTSQKELPKREEFDGESRYCFKNTTPIQTLRTVSEFNPNGELGTTGNELNGSIIENIEVIASQQVPIQPLSDDTISKTESDGRYLVIIFRPSKQDVPWSCTGSGNIAADNMPKITGSHWLTLKKWENNTVIYDTNNQTVPQTMFIFLHAMLNTINYPLIFTIDGTLTIYNYYGNTSREISANYDCPTCRNFIPIRVNSLRAVYINDLDEFTLRKDIKRMTKTLITETQDGFWRIATENFKIKVKMSIEGWGIMGGPFSNWLVESGFKTVEENYSYLREGNSVRAVSITTPHPTKQVGKWDPGIGPIWFTGKLMTISSGDFINVWYTEDEWLLSNSIYAKNFVTDLIRRFEITANSDQFLFRQNKLGDLGKINNTPGRSVIEYSNGGFGQIDSSVYTGLAIYLRFKVINPEYPTQWQLVIPKTDPFYNAFSGVDQDTYNDLGDQVEVVGNGTLVHQGFMSGYPKQSFEFDTSVTYTVLLPSDPEFTTGGWQYQESITAPLYDQIRELTTRVNELISKNNISDITSSVMSILSLATSFPSLFSGVVDAFKSVMNFVKKMKKSNIKVGLSRVKFGKKIKVNGKETTIDTPTLFTSVATNTPATEFSNLFSDDEIFSILHGISNSAKKKSIGTTTIIDNATQTIPLDPIAATKISYSTPHTIATVKSIRPKELQTIETIIPEIRNSKLVQFDQINNKISTFGRNGYIANYAIDEDLLDYIISNLGNGHARTLFSLNLRKRIIQSKKKDGFIRWDSEDVLKQMLDDKELFDITKGLTPDLIRQFYDEFSQILTNALGD
nr:VP4 [Bat RVJ-like rotavirus BtSY1]